MSITRTENLFGDTAAYGGFIDAAGGIAFLHKPFPTKMLIDAMNKALEQSKTR